MIDYGIELVTVDGLVETLETYRGRALLVVNTASACGFTGQYAELEELYRRYAHDGLTVLAFPCNQFGGQEPRSDDEIERFCQEQYDVTFPIHVKVDVNGDEAHPLFVQLKRLAPGALGTEVIKWNFTKFLIGRDGEVINRYSPATPPSWLHRDIEAALSSPFRVGG